MTKHKDVLADTLGKGPGVAAWTSKAMSGNTKFEDALAARLEIIQPSRSDIASCLEKHPLRLSPGVDRLVAALQKRGTDVYLVSGGFRLMINPVADSLNIPLENIYANTILFDGDGKYSGFDAAEPTSADQGKPKALSIIKEKFGYKTMIMVGDGATDAQAKPPADAFIGFGGVVVRDAVKAKACWFVRDFETMIDIVSRSDKGFIPVFQQEKVFARISLPLGVVELSTNHALALHKCVNKRSCSQGLVYPGMQLETLKLIFLVHTTSQHNAPKSHGPIVHSNRYEGFAILV
eukprot:scaffold5000_cov76-Cyclotella_meneghiniana.AAC.1